MKLHPKVVNNNEFGGQLTTFNIEKIYTCGSRIITLKKCTEMLFCK